MGKKMAKMEVTSRSMQLQAKNKHPKIANAEKYTYPMYS
jgi:hypothetical protein